MIHYSMTSSPPRVTSFSYVYWTVLHKEFLASAGSAIGLVRFTRSSQLLPPRVPPLCTDPESTGGVLGWGSELAFQDKPTKPYQTNQGYQRPPPPENFSARFCFLSCVLDMYIDGSTSSCPPPPKMPPNINPSTVPAYLYTRMSGMRTMMYHALSENAAQTCVKMIMFRV